MGEKKNDSLFINLIFNRDIVESNVNDYLI